MEAQRFGEICIPGRDPGGNDATWYVVNESGSIQHEIGRGPRAPRMTFTEAMVLVDQLAAEHARATQ